jgi:hypothetical protein
MIGVAERTCFGCTAGVIIFRIEVEYDIFFAEKTLQAYWFACE